MSFAFSCWLRPYYREIYEHNVFMIDGSNPMGCYDDFFTDSVAHGVITLFEKEDSSLEKGLWFVSGRANLHCFTQETPIGLERDFEYIIEDIYVKRKCYNRVELRDKMMQYDLVFGGNFWGRFDAVQKRERSRLPTAINVNI